MQAAGWLAEVSIRWRQTANPSGLGMPRRAAFASRGLPNSDQPCAPGATWVSCEGRPNQSTPLADSTPPPNAAITRPAAISPGILLARSLASQPFGVGVSGV